MDIARVHKIKLKYAKEPFSNDIANYIFIAYIYKHKTCSYVEVQGKKKSLIKTIEIK